jgi:hypothetical protein
LSVEEQFSSLMADIATFDLSPIEKAELFQQLIAVWGKGFIK